MGTAVMQKTTADVSPEVPEPLSTTRAKREAPPPKKPKAKIILAVLAITAATAGTAAWAAARGKQSTDDAFVEAHVASVASRIQGQVERVNVKDNQLVEVGTVLVDIDDRDAKMRLLTAEADQLSARASLSAAETQLALAEKNADAH